MNTCCPQGDVPQQGCVKTDFGKPCQYFQKHLPCAVMRKTEREVFLERGSRVAFHENGREIDTSEFFHVSTLKQQWVYNSSWKNRLIHKFQVLIEKSSLK